MTHLLELMTTTLHSYGLAIILFTILVRAILAPLNMRQLRSAKRMSNLAPKIKELQQKYKGDRETLTKAQMALYKEEGVNPAAGCLPLLLQMPILYSLFWVFQNLAHASSPHIYKEPFLWFLLNHPDPTHILPVLAGVLQWIQQRMMMQPTSDPQQRTTMQIMQFMPLMIIVFALRYPSGLALYWVTSTSFSIVLQYFITGWGQLFKSPFSIPSVAPATGVTANSRRQTPPAPPADANGKNGNSPKETATPTPRTTRPPMSNDDGQDSTEGNNGARLGKMQRAAMRPKTRPRPSKGAKR
jgi:YidC/Oxa1 family membrane protein insertase